MMFGFTKEQLDRHDEVFRQLKMLSLADTVDADKQLVAVFGPEADEPGVRLLRSAVSGSLFGDSKVPKA